jgi:CRISPR-associated protein Cas2
MALNLARAWLIAYDITEPRRLKRMNRALKRRAIPVQYSVFAAHDTPAAVGRMRRDLGKLIDVRTDDVRIYPVPSNPELAVVGLRALPEGVLVLREGTQPEIFTG